MSGDFAVGNSGLTYQRSSKLKKFERVVGQLVGKGRAERGGGWLQIVGPFGKKVRYLVAGDAGMAWDPHKLNLWVCFEKIGEVFNLKFV